MEAIIGVPGAGKTELAITMAKAHTSKVVYISYSQESSASAKVRFGDAAWCYSIHAFCKNYLKIDSKRITEKWDVNILKKYIHLSTKVEIKDDELRDFLLFFKTFLGSNVNQHQARTLFNQVELRHLSNRQKATFTAALKGLWPWLCSSESALLHHDIYLKMLSLSDNVPVKFDLLFVDEFQDLNEVMFALLENLERHNPHLKIVLFGDICQQIHAYRGSTQKILNVPVTKTLSDTHRFGVDLANMINKFMAEQGTPNYTDIKGSHKIKTDISTYKNYNELIQSAQKGDKPTCICRTNAEVIYAAVEMTNAGLSVAIKGNVLREINFFQKVLDLKFGHGEFKAKYRNFDNYRMMASSINDYQMIVAGNICEQLKDRNTFRTMQQHLCPPQQADVLLTNVHQAKGLQFRNVFIGLDFFVKFDGQTFKKIRDNDAVKIIYTALSRAKNSIKIPAHWGLTAGSLRPNNIPTTKSTHRKQR